MVSCEAVIGMDKGLLGGLDSARFAVADKKEV